MAGEGLTPFPTGCVRNPTISRCRLDRLLSMHGFTGRCMILGALGKLGWLGGAWLREKAGGQCLPLMTGWIAVTIVYKKGYVRNGPVAVG